MKRLRGVLRTRFADAPDARAELEAARDDDGEDPVLVSELAGHLAAAEEADPPRCAACWPTSARTSPTPPGTW